jgi:uncharacterized surface protein with fasciclin (FAS1) repeats
MALGAVLALGVLGTASPAVAQPAEAVATKRNIVQTAVAAGQFKTLVTLATRAGLAGTLSGKTKLTVFAPTDAAFKRVPRATLKALLADRKLLRRVLLYHVVPGNVRAARVAKLRSARTVAGPRVRIAVRRGQVYLNGTTRVTRANITASNGTIHVINRVLLPPAS